MGLADIRSRIAAAKHARLSDAVLWNGEAKSVFLAKAGDQPSHFGDSVAILEDIRFDVLKSVVAVPAIGDIVEIVADGRRFRVSAEPMTSVSGLEWHCSAEKA